MPFHVKNQFGIRVSLDSQISALPEHAYSGFFLHEFMYLCFPSALSGLHPLRQTSPSVSVAKCSITRFTIFLHCCHTLSIHCLLQSPVLYSNTRMLSGHNFVRSLGDLFRPGRFTFENLEKPSCFFDVYHQLPLSSSNIAPCPAVLCEEMSDRIVLVEVVS